MSIKLGEVVKSVAIKRSDVAQGTRGRAVLVDDPRATYIAFDNDNKCAVYMDQEAMIQYGLTSRTYYFLLLARMNTDMKGNIIGEDFTIEYLRLSDQLYEEFIEQYSEMDNVGTILLKKEIKKSGNSDFSYVKPIPSKDVPPQAVLDKLAKIDTTAIWSLVQVDAARTIEQYEKLLADKAKTADISEDERRQIAAASSGVAQVGAPRVARPPRIAASKADVAEVPPVVDATIVPDDEFGDGQGGDDFNED